MIKLKYKSLSPPSSTFMKHVNLKPTLRLWNNPKFILRVYTGEKWMLCNKKYASTHNACNQSPIWKCGGKEMKKWPSYSRLEHKATDSEPWRKAFEWQDGLDLPFKEANAICYWRDRAGPHQKAISFKVKCNSLRWKREKKRDWTDCA